MIEMLVASTILIVIVMMLAMLFQQTSLSWRTGVRRADAFVQIRSAIGAIQRDASAAVDKDTIPLALRSKLVGAQNFNGPLEFYTLTGDGYKDAGNPKNGHMDQAEKPFRALKHVKYVPQQADLCKRIESTLLADNTVDGPYESDVLNFVDRAGSVNKPHTTIKNITPFYGPGGNAGLPLFITIEAEVTYSGNTLEIGTGSAGPDKTWNTKDDIKTWVEN